MAIDEKNVPEDLAAAERLHSEQLQGPSVSIMRDSHK